MSDTLLADGLAVALESRAGVKQCIPIPALHDTPGASDTAVSHQHVLAECDVVVVQPPHLDALAQCAEVFAGTPVVALCAHRCDEALVLAADHGLAAVVSMSSPLSVLVETVATAGRGTRVLDASAVRAARSRLERERAVWSMLSERDVEVLSLVAEGLTDPQVAARLGVHPQTVRNRMSMLLARLGVANRTQAAVWFATVAAPLCEQAAPDDAAGCRVS